MRDNSRISATAGGKGHTSFHSASHVEAKSFSEISTSYFFINSL